MDTKVIRSFLLVADIGSFTKAAQKLHYAQSTLSTQIQQLEHEIGYVLFDRVGNKVTLTAMGYAFYQYAKQIDMTIQQIAVLGKAEKDVRATLAIGAAESLILSSIISAIVLYRKIYPNVDIQITSGPSVAYLKEELKQNMFDFIYISHHENQDKQLVCLYKRKEKMLFVASHEHPLAGQHNISLTRLFSYPFTRMERVGGINQRLESIALKAGHTPQFSLEIGSLVAVIKILKDYGGIALLPAYAVQQELLDGSLVELDVDVGDQTYYSQILVNKKKWLPPFATAFIDTIKELRPDNKEVNL